MSDVYAVGLLFTALLYNSTFIISTAALLLVLLLLLLMLIIDTVIVMLLYCSFYYCSTAVAMPFLALRELRKVRATRQSLHHPICH